ncbi:MAG: hypothetical protein AB1706_03925 [Pseudomonadota bacterium]
MDNYKIKVKGELDISKATLALNSLGYVLGNLPKDSIHVIYAMADKTVQYVTYDDGYDYHGIEAKDLTVDQLKDKAVLHRNNPNDGNYSLFISEPQGHLNLYKTSEDIFYVFCSRLNIWDKSRAVNINTEGLVKKGGEKDPALISGDVALANVHKCIVQYLHDDEPYGRWTTITDHLWSQYHLGMFLDPDTKFKFRFKPQTIKLELELPKPFEPKEGDEYFYISTLQHCLYSHDVWSDEPADITQAAFGAYRTEDDVKKAVEQLRKLRGAS